MDQELQSIREQILKITNSHFVSKDEEIKTILIDVLRDLEKAKYLYITKGYNNAFTIV